MFIRMAIELYFNDEIIKLLCEGACAVELGDSIYNVVDKGGI